VIKGSREAPGAAGTVSPQGTSAVPVTFPPPWYTPPVIQRSPQLRRPSFLLAVLLVTAALSLSACGSDKGVNEECGGNDDCASKICHQSICASDKPQPVGWGCHGRGDCSTFRCEKNQCAAGDAEVGEPCLRGEQCKTERCYEGKCADPAICGDLNIAPPDEECDQENLDKKNCASLGFDLGDLTCNGECKFDTSDCVKHQWKRIEPGSFSMGSPTSEADRGSNESQHDVTLTHAFEMMTTEVTQRQFSIAGRYEPSQFHEQGICKDGDCPVENLRWDEAVNYCNRLSLEKGIEACYDCQSSGKTVFCTLRTKFYGSAFYGCPGYRLPTEAEFEYAYRAGTKGPYQDKSADAIGWTQQNAAGSPHPVGQKAPNAWGLYDLSGNVSEWCQDWYKEDLGTAAQTDPSGPNGGEHRITRGGSWSFPATRARAASRLLSKQDNRLYDVGFRCVRTLP
jgi:formylglycine-generating enzyme required for sulfatase activity